MKIYSNIIGAGLDVNSRNNQHKEKDRNWKQAVGVLDSQAVLLNLWNVTLTERPWEGSVWTDVGLVRASAGRARVAVVVGRG